MNSPEDKSARGFLRSLADGACLALILSLVWALPAEAHTLSGRAYSAYINTPTLGAGPLYVSDSGELAPDGGWVGAGLLSTQVPNILSANTLVAATVGQVGYVSSSTSLADIVVLPGHSAELTASFVRAEAKTTEIGSQGSSQIQGLTLGGQAISVTGAPNQTVSLLGIATLIINEQVATA